MLWLAISVPARPQSPLEALDNSAPVVVDGRMLFRVYSTDTLSAEERAARINRNISDAISSHGQMVVQLERAPDGQQTNITADGNHILTVTEVDTLPQLTPEFQARVWQGRLQSALERALEERNPTYRRRALGLSAILLVGAIGAHLLIGLCYRISSRRAYRSRRKLSQRWVRLPAIYLGFLLLRIGIWGGVTYQITQLWPLLRGWRYQLQRFVLASFQEPLLFTSDEGGGYSLLDVVILLGLTAGVWVGAVAFARGAEISGVASLWGLLQRARGHCPVDSVRPADFGNHRDFAGVGPRSHLSNDCGQCIQCGGGVWSAGYSQEFY